MSKRNNWRYDLLKPLDIGFCRASSPVGVMIRMITGAKWNHVFIITTDHGQYAATEMTARGCILTSLEKYTKMSNYCGLILRWNGWTSDSIDTVEQWLALLRRRAAEPKNYGWYAFTRCWGWISRSKAPIDKDGEHSMYCSELVVRCLMRGGYRIPDDWRNRWPSPGALADRLLFDGATVVPAAPISS